jgi:hypothetical protein
LELFDIFLKGDDSENTTAMLASSWLILCVKSFIFTKYGTDFLYAYSLPFCTENSQGIWSMFYILPESMNMSLTFSMEIYHDMIIGCLVALPYFFFANFASTFSIKTFCLC